jgi:protein-L-isoaspartate(D-aspartate) O-methyltransferase
MISALERFELVMQLRKRGVRDTRVLRAVECTPRDLFVDPAFMDRAHLDLSLPIDCGQTISSPFLVAYMTEKLAPMEDNKILEIGTGSGYQTTVLAQLCRHVYTIERHPTLQRLAVQRFTKLGLENVTAVAGDGWLGWPGGGEFDRVIVNASTRELPRHLLDILTPGGRMIVPIGLTSENQFIVEATKDDFGPRARKLAPSRFAPLARGKMGA